MIELRNFVKNIRPYKPGKPIEEVVRELGIKEEIIKLSSNENPLGPSPKAVQAIKEKIENINIYPDDNCFYLKKKLSEKFNIPPNNITVGSGSVELIELIFKAYVNPGDEIIMSDPSFIMYKIACHIFGGKRIAIPLKDHAHDIETMAKAINRRTKIIILDNPINPTGTIIRNDKFNYFIEKVPENVILVVDEAYKEYIENENYPNAIDSLKKHENIIILHTFSKIYGLAGLRVGYGFSSTNIIAALMKVRLPFNVNRIAQIATTAALDDDEFVKKSYKNNEAGKEFLYKELKRLNLKYTPTYGNFILVHFECEAKNVFQAAQKRGVILRTILEYGLPNSLRITIGTPQQNKRLIEVLRKII
ncbi:histidinol-phosphate transaminase [candidate division WOR-3 bacterium]|nr:histidinol-phosphate transaminase [candidate division WOR-3 bacterium]